MTKEDIDMLLSESDGKELTDMGREVSEALHDRHIPMPNIEQELNKVMPVRHHHSMWRIAAVIAASVIIFGGLAYAFIGMNIIDRQSGATAEAAEEPVCGHADNSSGETEGDAMGDFVFEEESMENIMNVLARHYGVRVEFRNPSARAVRMHMQIDRNMSLDSAVTFLNTFTTNIHITLESDTLYIE